MAGLVLSSLAIGKAASVLWLKSRPSWAASGGVLHGCHPRKDPRLWNRGVGIDLALSVLAVLSSLAWHLGLWLVAVAGLSAAVTLTHGEVSRRQWLSSRLAAWPEGLEGVMAADLAIRDPHTESDD